MGVVSKEGFKHWSKIIAKFMSIQVLIKALGLLVNIVLIRYLAKADYAYFTIGLSILQTLVLLSDAGIGTGMMAIGGRHWQGFTRMGQLVNSAMALRKRQFLIAAIGVLPIMIWLLWKNDASLVHILTLCMAVLVGASFELPTVIYTVVLKLNNEYDKVQYIDIINVSFRLITIGLLSFIFLQSYIAIWIISLAFGINYFVSKKWASAYADPKAKTHLSIDRKEINQIIIHQLPGAIYFCLIGQISIFLISVFGSTASVAEVGVLSRLAVIFTVINVTVATVIMPRFSKSQTADQIQKWFFLMLAGLILMGLVLLGFAYVFPDFFLFVFGKKYIHLDQELLWVVGNGMVYLITGIIFQINSSRGWILKWWIFIPVGVATQVISLFFLDVSTVIGVIQYNIILCIPELILLTLLFFYQLKQMRMATPGLQAS